MCMVDVVVDRMYVVCVSVSSRCRFSLNIVVVGMLYCMFDGKEYCSG